MYLYAIVEAAKGERTRPPKQSDILRKREGLLLSGPRVLHDLEVAQSPSYQDILRHAPWHPECEPAGLEDHRYKQR